jgi:hypothetical protein
MTTTAQTFVTVPMTASTSEFMKTGSITTPIAGLSGLKSIVVASTPTSATSPSNWLRDAIAANQNLGFVTSFVRPVPSPSPGPSNLPATSPDVSLLASQLSSLLINAPASAATATGACGFDPSQLNLFGTGTLLSAVT